MYERSDCKRITPGRKMLIKVKKAMREKFLADHLLSEVMRETRKEKGDYSDIDRNRSSINMSRQDQNGHVLKYVAL